jgi:EPS-associated MarR family transcriptional regulator
MYLIMIELELKLLEAIEKNQHCTQRESAKSLGISLGKINFCLKALLKKSYIKLENFSRNPNKSGYVYLLTSKGMAEKVRLTKAFLIRQQAEYDRLRVEISYYQDKVNQYLAKNKISPKD